MTHARSFEEVIAERTQTLDMMRATIDRMHYLIDLIAAQVNLEHQYSNTRSDSQPPTVEPEDRSHG